MLCFLHLYMVNNNMVNHPKSCGGAPIHHHLFHLLLLQDLHLIIPIIMVTIVTTEHQYITQVRLLTHSLTHFLTYLLTYLLTYSLTYYVTGSFHSNNSNVLVDTMYEDNNAKYRTRANNMLNVEASIAQMVLTHSLTLTHSLLLTLLTHSLTYLRRDNYSIKLQT